MFKFWKKRDPVAERHAELLSREVAAIMEVEFRQQTLEERQVPPTPLATPRHYSEDIMRRRLPELPKYSPILSTLIEENEKTRCKLRRL